MKSVAVIGAGNMGGAIIGAIASDSGIKKESIYVYDKFVKDEIKNLGVKCVSIKEAVLADCIILAVKPNVIESVCEDIKNLCDVSQKVVVSIAAGIKISTLEGFLSSKKIIRVMPNICLTAGEGMSVMCKSEEISEDELSFVKDIFDLSGKTTVIKEELIDACTAINGSGPAYVFMFMEAMADAAVSLGIDRKTAYELCGQTVLGSASLMLKSGIHPADLKDRVCSPGGTTIEAVKALENAGLRSAVFSAVTACAKKAKEMGKS